MLLLLFLLLSSAEVSYQVHSYNSLALYPALFEHGVSWYKLDVFYLSKALCANIKVNGSEDG